MSASRMFSRAQLDAEQSLLEALEERLEAAQEAERNAQCAVEAAKRTMLESSSAVHAAQAATDSFKQSIKQSRALITPLSTLPLDILADVIRTWVVSADAPNKNHNGGYIAPAFAAASVCRQWREAALSLSSIWTSIYLDFTFLNQANKYLELALHRSRNHPLVVEMIEVPADMKDARQLDEALLLRMFPRAQDISVRFSCVEETTFESSILPYFQLPMPHLKWIKFEGDGCSLPAVAPGTQILTLAPNLKHLHILVPTIFTVLAPNTLPNVEEFNISANLTPSTLRTLAAAWPRLRALSMMGFETNTPASQAPIDVASLEALTTLSSLPILPFLSVLHAPRVASLDVLWVQSTLAEIAQFLAPRPRLASIGELTLSFLPHLCTEHGAHECMTVFAQLPSLALLTLVHFDADSLRELFRVWGAASAQAALPRHPAKLTELTLQKCEFDQRATHAFLNFLVLRQDAAAAGTRIRSLTIHQSDSPLEPEVLFPSWLRPQLERLVSEVHFTSL